jgi:hypothetical protein
VWELQLIFKNSCTDQAVGWTNQGLIPGMNIFFISIASRSTLGLRYPLVTGFLRGSVNLTTPLYLTGLRMCGAVLLLTLLHSVVLN